jgi:transcriptional regulator with XRE-family HTH domain
MKRARTTQAQAKPSVKERPKSAARATRRAAARAVDHHLGHQVRDLRRAKGLTIPELAARIDRSVGWLSQIERGISAVTISALHQIAAALEVQVSWFFAQAAPPPADDIGYVVRKGQRRKLDFHGSGVHEEILSPNLSGQLLLVETTFAPGASTGDRDRERRGEEAGVVLSGTLELHVESRTLRLQAGDSFAFTRRGPHRCHNPGRVDAVVLWIITPPSY